MSLSNLVPNVDLLESQQHTIKGAIAVTYFLAVLCVGLRFLSRRLIHLKYWLDDWLILASLFTLTGGLINTKLWVDNGVGRHVELFGPDVFDHVFKGLFVGWIFYAINMCIVKFSILALYWRIFQVKSIRLPIYILTGVTATWGFVTILVTVFQCHPVSGFWNRTTGDPGACKIDIQKFFVAISVFNIITDIAILTLPIRYIWKLPKTRSQKASVYGMFLLGGLVVIIASIRTGYVVTDVPNTLDVTWQFSNIAIWTMPEGGVAIMSACLPCLRPVYLLVTGRPPTTTSEKPKSRDDEAGPPSFFRSHSRRRPAPPPMSFRAGTPDIDQPLLSPFPAPQPNKLNRPEEMRQIDQAYRVPSSNGSVNGSICEGKQQHYSEIQIWLDCKNSPKSPEFAAYVKDQQHQAGVRAMPTEPMSPYRSMDTQVMNSNVSLLSGRTFGGSYESLAMVQGKRTSVKHHI